jgi:hypothetical protein
MSTTQTKVPVVTYTLLPVFERKLSNKKLAEEQRVKMRGEEAALLEAKEENDKRLSEKKALYKRVIVPFSVFQEKAKERKAREDEIEEARRQQRLEQDILLEQKEWTEKMKEFKKEVRLAKVVPHVVNYLPTAFQESEIGKEYSLEIDCGEVVVPTIIKLAQIVGFDVGMTEREGKITLLLRKPYPYLREAFSDKKAQ